MSDQISYNSFIKNIWLELPGYKFEHKAMGDPNHAKWVGRADIEDKLESYLDTKNGSESGAYLITGYRGMGKTSFVKRVIEKYKTKSKFNIRVVTISFGQKDIKELDILRQMIKGIKEGILLNGTVKLLHTKVLNIKNIPFWVALTFLIIFIYRDNKTVLFSKDSFEVISTMLIASIIISYLALTILRNFFVSVFPSVKYYDILEDLFDRCRSQITKEAGSSGAGERLPFGLVDKLVKRFPIANPKEVENEIISILHDFNKREGKYLFFKLITTLPYFLLFSFLANILFTSIPFLLCLAIIYGIALIIYLFLGLTGKAFSKGKFIFVFDEIDKIDPSPDKEYYNEELDKVEKQSSNSGMYEFRERKRVVINILANLKYLISTAEAKFIFIAGREMFDAALADIADRQSAVSSIFHQVINIDSFLKDTSQNSEGNYPSGNLKTIGLTGLVEEYLARILFETSKPNEKLSNNREEALLKRYFLSLDHERHGEITLAAKYKIIYTLQNLIVYLTYRSNGSPKKLVRLIEEMIKLEPIDLKKNEIDGVTKSVNEPKNIFIYQTLKSITKFGLFWGNKKTARKYFLRINYANQYRFDFINYLFRPYVASYGNYYKEFSDKILVSTPFLFDHIIKFHPFAFSLQNLELIPEVLSETRSPELRNFIEDLVTFLSQSHIRDTEIGLFEYKFIHKSTNEIVYLCKSFEDESAAFNFTLDETFHVKLHLSNKIRELRNNYKKFGPEGFPQYVKSISFMNENLGDAQFFDGGYDEAITSYSDSIEQLVNRFIDPRKNNIDFEDFVIYMRLQLKIGLSYEKIKAYENAVAVYVESIKIAQLFIKKNDFLNEVSSKTDLLQIIVQPYLAELFLIEKLSIEGVMLKKIANSQSQFLDVLNLISFCNEKNYLIESNYYSNIGTLLLYKNLSERAENVSDEKEAICEFKKLTCYEEIIKRKSEGEFRDYSASASSYAFFKKSISTLFKYIDPIHDISGNDIIKLLQNVENYIGGFINTDLINLGRSEPIYEARRDRAYLKNLAVSLYKLGDSLYGSLVEINEEGLVISDDLIKIAPKLFKEIDTTNGAEFWSFQEFSFNDWNKKYKKLSLQFKKKNQIKSLEVINALNVLLFQLIMCIYFWAGQILMYISKNLSCSFMFRKIMLSFRMVASPATCRLYYELMEKYFLQQVLRIASWNSNASDRYQIYKYKYSFNLEEITPPDKSKSIYLSASSSTEVKEAIILTAELRLKSLREVTNEPEWKINNIIINLQDSINEISGLISPYNTISTQFIRYHELRLQVELNEMEVFYSKNYIINLFHDWTNAINAFDYLNCTAFENIFNEKFQKIIRDQIIINPNFLTDIATINQKIANSIFCLYQIIKIYNGYGVNYIMSYSSLGNYHKKFGKWLKLYDFSKNIVVPGHESLTDMVKGLIGADIIRTRDSTSEYQIALQNYSKARQMHSQGAPYKNEIINMYYLEDDFNDSLYHFSIVVERQRINSQKMRRKIVSLQKLVDISPLYNFKSYVNSHKLN